MLETSEANIFSQMVVIFMVMNPMGYRIRTKITKKKQIQDIRQLLKQGQLALKRKTWADIKSNNPHLTGGEQKINFIDTSADPKLSVFPVCL